MGETIGKAFEDFRRIVLENSHRIIGTIRNWNNSMGFYYDRIIVWNGEKGEPETIDLGIDTLNVGGVSIDVESEAYKAYRKYVAKLQKKLKRENFRRDILELLHHGKFTAGRIVKFLDKYGKQSAKYNTIHNLLMVKNFRSGFRKSLAGQVIGWLKTPASKQKYAFPLSEKQFESICRYTFYR